jgi:hypothetical protein
MIIFWKTNSLRINHMLQATAPKRYNTRLVCLLDELQQKLKISTTSEGEKGHPKASLHIHQQKLASAQWKKI